MKTTINIDTGPSSAKDAPGSLAIKPARTVVTLAQKKQHLVLKINYDKEVFLSILHTLYITRISLYGLSLDNVKKILYEAIEFYFKKHHSEIKKQYRASVNHVEAVSGLKIQFYTFLSSITDEIINNTLIDQSIKLSKENGTVLFVAYLYNLIRFNSHVLDKYKEKIVIPIEEVKKVEASWKKLLRTCKNHYSASEMLTHKYTHKIIKSYIIGLLSTLSLILIASCFKNDKKYLQTANIVSFGMLIILFLFMVATHFFKKKTRFSIIPENMKEMLDRIIIANCNTYVNTQRLSYNDFPLLADLLPIKSTSQIYDEKENPTAVVKPPKRYQTSSNTDSKTTSNVAKIDEQQLSIFKFGNSSYYRLTGCSEGTFYHHDEKHQLPRLKLNSGRDDELFKAIENIVSNDTKIHPETHKGAGLKRVGQRESRLYKGKYKLKLTGSLFGSLRIDTPQREPTSQEISILNNCKAIISPKRIVNK